jgi:hypothetical protein
METEFGEIPVKSVDSMVDLEKHLINWLHFISKTRTSYKTDPLDFWRADASPQNFIALKSIAMSILCTQSWYPNIRSNHLDRKKIDRIK